MIKITKPGQKEFHGFCKWCGCEFTYEISDLMLSATYDRVSCPTCGKDYLHPSMIQDPTIPGGIGYRGLQDITLPHDPISCTPDMTYTDPCARCAWREKLLRDGIYIGDTPCTWCSHNKFGYTTSGTSVLQSVDYPKAYFKNIAHGIASATSVSAADGVAETKTIHLDPIKAAGQVDSTYIDDKLQEVYNLARCSAVSSDSMTKANSTGVCNTSRGDKTTCKCNRKH